MKCPTRDEFHDPTRHASPEHGSAAVLIDIPTALSCYKALYNAVDYLDSLQEQELAA